MLSDGERLSGWELKVAYVRSSSCISGLRNATYPLGLYCVDRSNDRFDWWEVATALRRSKSFKKRSRNTAGAVSPKDRYVSKIHKNCGHTWTVSMHERGRQGGDTGATRLTLHNHGMQNQRRAKKIANTSLLSLRESANCFILDFTAVHILCRTRNFSGTSARTTSHFIQPVR